MNDETCQFIDDFRTKHKNINIVSAGSSLKFCLIAEDLADVYTHFSPTMEWDTAAGQAIIEGAGGKITIYCSAKQLNYNSKVSIQLCLFQIR